MIFEILPLTCDFTLFYSFFLLNQTFVFRDVLVKEYFSYSVPNYDSFVDLFILIYHCTGLVSGIYGTKASKPYHFSWSVYS